MVVVSAAALPRKEFPVTRMPANLVFADPESATPDLVCKLKSADHPLSNNDLSSDPKLNLNSAISLCPII